MINKIIEGLQAYFVKLDRKRKIIVSIALLGIIFLLIGNFIKEEKEDPIMFLQEEKVEEVSKIKEDLMADINEMEQMYEEDLKTMLNKVNGVTEVEVMVNIDSTNIKIYEKDVIYGQQTTVETDQSGGKRTVEDETKETNLIFVRQGDEEVPVLLTTEKPPIRGVFIIAKGVGNASVKKNVVEAVSRVLDVPTYRISVLPK